MHIFESKFYSVLIKMSDFFLLNLLWFIMCMPIITIFSATSSMFGVIYHWRTINDHEIIRPFFYYFKKTIKQNLFMNFIANIVIFLIYIYLLEAQFMPEVVLTAAWISFGVVLLLSVSILVFYFPMIVRFPKTKTKELLVNSLILSISQFPLTILAVCGIFIGLFAILKLPLLVLCLASLISYYVYSCSEKIFEKVETIS